MRIAQLILATGSIWAAEVEPIPLSQLMPRVGKLSEIAVDFTGGTALRSVLLGAKLADGGAVRIAGWPTLVAPCRTIGTITFEARGRGTARGLLGTAIAFGAIYGGAKIVTNGTGYTGYAGLGLIFGSPAIGFLGAPRVLPKQRETVSLVCP